MAARNLRVSALALFVPFGLGCSMIIGIDHDYTDRLASGGAIASGGATASGGSSMVDAGRTSGAGTQPSAGFGNSDPAICAGISLHGVCWYFGELGQSCASACLEHGGEAPSAASFIGVSAQGGSLAKCTEILARLNRLPAPTSAERFDSLGLGCHSFGAQNYWLRAPLYSSFASNRNAQLACGCRE